MIGIPSVRNRKDFHDSMDAFLPALAKVHQIEVIEVRNRPVDEARNKIAEFFLSKEYDYLLFLDDDHTGHTVEMVEALLKPDAPVCAIKCYAKKFPHFCALMDYSSSAKSSLGRYVSKETNQGYEECDLVGFGMTLIRREVFLRLQKPYFLAFEGIKEDCYFCDNLKSIGVKILGCFDFTLCHDGIGEHNVKDLMEEGASDIAQKIQDQEPGFKLKELIFIN